METSIIVALISAAATVVAALIAIIPHFLKRRKAESATQPQAPAPAAPTPSPGPMPEINLELVGSSPSPAPAPAGGIVESPSYRRIAGVSPSSQRAPREIDFVIEGSELVVHIHAPNGSGSGKYYVYCSAFLQAVDKLLLMQPREEIESVEVAGRTARNPAAVVVRRWRGEDELEIQAGWWIWVRAADLKTALATFRMV
jgi:hypothetical protein